MIAGKIGLGQRTGGPLDKEGSGRGMPGAFSLTCGGRKWIPTRERWGTEKGDRGKWQEDMPHVGVNFLTESLARNEGHEGQAHQG